MTAVVRARRRTDRDAIRMLRWILSAAAVTVGIGASLFDKQPGRLAIVLLTGALLIGSLLITRRTTDLRYGLVADGLIAAAAIAVTGGASSPLLLALVGPLLLAGVVRSVGVTWLLIAAAGPALLIGDSAPSLVTSMTGVLVVTAMVGSAADALVDSRRAQAAVLEAATAERDRLRRLADLLDGVGSELRSGTVAMTSEELMAQARHWLALVHEPDVVAFRAGDEESSWERLGADGHVRTLRRRAPPVALSRGDQGGPVTIVPDLPAGDGLDTTTRRAAYLWLHAERQPGELLAFEWERPARFEDLEVALLHELREVFELMRSAGDRLQALRLRSEQEERLRVAADLHDEIAQDLAYAAMELQIAARRHADDTSLAALTPVLRRIIFAVRGTITHLRAGEPVP